VLEGEGTEGPKKVGGLTHPFGEPVRPTHQERTSLAGIAFDSLHLFRERAAGKLFSALIEHEAKATLAATEQLAAFAQCIGGLDMRGVHRGKTPQSREIFGDARASVRESRFANCNDTPAQGAGLVLMTDGIKIRRVVRASDERAAGNKVESLAAGDFAVKSESFGIDVFDHRQVLGCWA